MPRDDDGRPGPGRPRAALPLSALPRLPAPLADLLLLASNASATARDLRDAVEQVPSFAACVLRALSAPGEGHGAAASIDQALREVGTRGVRGVVSALALTPLFEPSPGARVDGAAVAAHGVACALWIAELAAALGRQPSVHLVTAALMHDVGMVLLDRFLGAEFEAARARARAEDRHHAQVEQDLVGITHARAGALLCARWALPPAVTALVAGHHGEDGAPDAVLLAAGDHLAARHGAPALPGAPPRPLPAVAGAALGVTPALLDGLAARAPAVAARVQAIRRAAAPPDVLDNP
ncbi:MAG: HDOD domain-containing protein [Planctomycetes bacterium]|nr:HDOD domain-containing protein [Planctomycetota bacterium]